VTPEATRGYCERELPGIAEALRAESYKETPTAVLSRGVAGIRGETIIVNFPGSVKAVRLCTRVLIPVMEHALSMLRGEGH
jgi:molybdopterin adenylyltransferase